jgi:hypothetical protein
MAAAAVQSLIGYFQNMGCTISLPNIPIDDNIKAVLLFASRFVEVLTKYLPGVPNFDLRCQLIILGIGLPLIIDILVTGYFQKPLQSCFHVLDLVAAMVVAIFVSMGTISGSYSALKIVLVIVGIYVVIRVIVGCRMRAKRLDGSISFYELVSDVCRFYCGRLVPDAVEEDWGMHEVTNKQALEREIQKYSPVVAVASKKCETFRSLGYLLAAVAILVVTLLVQGIIPGLDMGAGMRVFWPYVGWPLVFILLVVFFLGLCQCGRNLLQRIGDFIGHWGLRILMLVLESLYIPILTALVSLAIPKNAAICPQGEFPMYVNGTNADSLRMFIARETECFPCDLTSGNVTNAAACGALCAGAAAWRNAADLHLSYNSDIFRPGIVVMIFVVVGIMVGIPALFYSVISTNTRFLLRINVFGTEVETKWVSLLNRLHSPGIFLFASYKRQYCKWQIVSIAEKFIVMLVTTIAAFVVGQLAFGLPVIYLAVGGFIAIKRPYVRGVNSFCDALLFFMNAFLAIVPILGLMGATIPQRVLGPVSLALVIVPVLLTIFLLLCSKSPFQADDPTVLEKLTDDEHERRRRIIEGKAARKKKERERQLQERREAGEWEQYSLHEEFHLLPARWLHPSHLYTCRQAGAFASLSSPLLPPTDKKRHRTTAAL